MFSTRIIHAALAICLCLISASVCAQNRILVVGDSLSAGYGFPPEQGWVSLLKHKLATYHPPYQVINASTNGDTTHDAWLKLPNLLKTHQPSILILELGGNDGLHGSSLDQAYHNLANMICWAQAKSIKVLLLGVRLPSNHDKDYVASFVSIYPKLAGVFDIPFVPKMLLGVGEKPELMQNDGIHPKAAAQQKILDNIWPSLVPLLKPETT